MRINIQNGGRIAFILLLVLLLPALLFLNNEAIWDDQTIFAEHNQWTCTALFGPYSVLNPSYWRPLTVVTMALPNLLGWPLWINKLASLIIYFFQGCLAITILNQYLRSRAVAARTWPLVLMAIMMAVHPVFVEQAFWISARADLLMGTFVLLGIYWLIRAYDAQIGLSAPEPIWWAALRGFGMVWLICASKDTGFVWATLGLLTTMYLAGNARTDWKPYWRGWAAGIVLAMASYVVLKFLALQQFSLNANPTQGSALAALDRCRLLFEFIARSILNIFLPLADSAPFKSVGWYAGLGPMALIALLLGVAALILISVRWISSKSRLAAVLAICGVLLIIFHAVITAINEPTQGSILSSRYLAPSAVLIFLALTMVLVNHAPAGGMSINQKSARQFNLPMLLVLSLILVQSLMLWTETRLSWSRNAELWENSWDHGSRAKIVVVNVAFAQLNAGNWATSRDIAREWIVTHNALEPRLHQCKLFNIAVQADILLKDQHDLTDLSTQALEVGWCNPTLAQNLAFVAMQTDCKGVLTMLDRAVSEGDKPEQAGLWKFDSAEQKEKLQLMAVYAEARCGSEPKATERLQEIAKRNSQWAPDGPMAAGLLKAARQ